MDEGVAEDLWSSIQAKQLAQWYAQERPGVFCVSRFLRQPEEALTFYDEQCSRLKLEGSYGGREHYIPEAHGRAVSDGMLLSIRYTDLRISVVTSCVLSCEQLKTQRERERKDAIRNGVLADPDKPTSLAHAITPVGTCQDMCPEYERVERIVQLMVDGCEKVRNTLGTQIGACWLTKNWARREWHPQIVGFHAKTLW